MSLGKHFKHIRRSEANLMARRCRL